jgi:hypothetical protein
VAILFVADDGVTEAFDLPGRRCIGLFACVPDAAKAAAKATDIYCPWGLQS